MPPPLPNGQPNVSAPSFGLIARQPVRPGVILLAVLLAAGALCLAVYVQLRFSAVRLALGSPDARRGGSGEPYEPPHTDDDDPLCSDGDPAVRGI